MADDPRFVILKMFDKVLGSGDFKVLQANLTDENGGNIGFEAAYEMSEQYLQKMMLEGPRISLFFILKRRPGSRALNTSSGPIGYYHDIIVQPVCIDKFYSDGSVKVSATKLADLALQEIRRVIRTNMSGSMRITREERTGIVDVGSTLVYGDEVNVEYFQDVEYY